MIMAKKSTRTIRVTKETTKELAKMFNCTERMVYKALSFESQTLLARRIQYVARKEKGGWVEASAPEEEIIYDTMSDGERFMRKYFNNGAVLEVSLTTGKGIVVFKGERQKSYSVVMVSEIPSIMDYAKSLR